MTERRPERPPSTRPAAQARDGRLAHPTSLPVDPFVWAALAMAPVLYLVELTGPRWLNLALRGIWVALVVLIGLLLVLRRRGRGRPGG